MKDKTLLKDKSVTIRLNPNQSFELDEISKMYDCSKSQLIRAALELILNRYEEKRKLGFI